MENISNSKNPSKMDNISNSNNTTAAISYRSVRKRTSAKPEQVRCGAFVDVWKIDDFRQRLANATSIQPILSPTFTHQFNEHTLAYKSKLYVVETADGGSLTVESAVERIANTTNKLKCYIRNENGKEMRVSCVSQRDYRQFKHVTQPSIVTNEAHGFIPEDVLTIVLQIGVTRVQDDFQPAKDARLAGDFRDLLESGSFSDVNVVVDRRCIKAHKAILACRSAVFATVLSREDCGDTVQIKDYSYDVVGELLRFCYTGSVGKVNTALLRASDEFDLPGLKIVCEEVLYRSIRVGNAAAMLIYAELYHASTLRGKTVEFIAENLKEVCKTPKFKTLSQSVLVEILGAWSAK